MATSSSRPDAMLTCLLISGSPASHAVAARLRIWADAGLVVPFVVIDLGAVSGVPGPAPLIPGRLLASGGPPQECDVLRLIAQGDWEHILMLSLFDVAASAGRGADPAGTAAAVAHEFRASMPVEADLLRSGPRRLTAVRLFAPTSEPDLFPQSWADFDPVWAYSLVLSPEDRAQPDTIADHVRWPGNYASHVAGAVAGLGGLWFGLGEPALPAAPGIIDESGTPDPAVQVIRVANRVAAARVPLEPVARMALAVAGGSEEPPDGARPGLRRSGSATSRALCQRAYLTLRNHPSQTLRYQSLPDAPPEKDIEIAGVELFDNYWRFLIGQPRGQARRRGAYKGAAVEPIFAPITAVRRWFDRTVQRTFQGEHTGRVFRSAPDLPHEMALDWTRRWEQAAGYGKRDEPFDPEADAVFWSQLRSVTLGLVDGQRPDVNPDHGAVVDVVGDRRLIVAGPEPAAIGPSTLHLVTADSAVSPFDVATTTTLLAELDAALEGSAQADDGSGSAPGPVAESSTGSGAWPFIIGATSLLLGGAALIAGQLQLMGVLVAAGFISLLLGYSERNRRPASAPVPQESDPWADWDHPEGQPLIDPDLVRGADGELLAELADDRALIPLWLREYGATVLGRLSTDVARDIDQATGDDTSFTEAFDQLAKPDFGDLKKRRRGWLLWFWACLLGYPTGLYLGYRLYQWVPDFSYVLPWDWVITKDTVFVWLFWTFTSLVLFAFGRAIVRYYKGFERARHALRRHALRCATLVRQRDHAEREAKRLRNVNQRLTKWAEVYAWLLLEPFPVAAPAQPHPQALALAPAVALEPVSPDHGASEDAAPDPQADAAKALSLALGTRISDVDVTGDFEASEVRNAVAAAASLGFMHDLFFSMVRHALGQLGKSDEELVRELDRDGRSATSYLGMFVRELRAGACRADARTELADKVSLHRARYVQSSDGEFGSMPLNEGSSATVSNFLAALTVPGASMRNTMFRPVAQLETQHRLAFGRLWTHAEGPTAESGGLIIKHIPVEPDPERLQLEAVRVDTTGAMHPSSLVCFVASPQPSSRRPHQWDDAASGLV